MKTLRVRQARLSELTGWGKAKTNDIYHGRTGYYREIVNEVAAALHLQPYELFLHPADAMAIRAMVRTQRQLEVSETLTAAADEEDAPKVAIAGRG